MYRLIRKFFPLPLDQRFIAARDALRATQS